MSTRRPRPRRGGRRRRRPLGRLAALAALPVLAAVALAGCGDDGGDGAAADVPMSSTITAPSSTTTSAPSTSTTSSAPAGAAGEVRTEVLEGSEADYEFQLAYPQVDGVPAAEEINLALEAEAQTIVEGFVEGTADFELFEGQPHSLLGDFEVTLLDGHLASFRLLTSRFMSGAAHPVQVVTTHSYDVETGQRVDLDALFADGVAWVELLSAAAGRELRAQLDDPSLEPTIAQGTAPDPANFQAFSVTEEGLMISFQEYQVGPHAIGTPTVVVPFDELAPVVDPDGPLAPYVE